MLSATFCFGQSSVPVTDFPVERNYHFQEAVQTGQNQIAVIYGRHDWYFFSSRLFIRHHDFNSNSAAERKIELAFNHQPVYLVSTFAHDSSLYFVCAATFASKPDLGWCVLRYGVSSGSLTTMIEPQSGNVLSQRVLWHGDVATAQSADSGFASVCITSDGPADSPGKVNAIVFSFSNATAFRTISVTMHDPITRYDHEQFLIGNDGSLYALGKQYIGHDSEIKNGEANYAYIISKSTAAGFRHQLTVPSGGSIIRSFNAVISDNVLLGSGLASDTTLTLHDSLVVIGMNLSDSRVQYRQTVALQHLVAINKNFPNRFTNTVSILNGKLLSVMEVRHVAYNESARAGNGFTYERGAAIVALTDKSGVIEKIVNVDKWQQFERLPQTSVHSFSISDASYVAYISARDIDRYGVLTVTRIDKQEEKKFTLDNADWEKGKPYTLFGLTRSIVGIQAHSRRYALFTVPVP